MRVTIIGCGYVGLTTAAALAYIGHRVHCIDANKERVDALNSGRIPIHEAWLGELISETKGRLSFGLWDTCDAEGSDVIIIAVGTPKKNDGGVDLTYVEAVAEELGRRLSGKSMPLVVNKSTVPVGSAKRVESVLTLNLRQRGIDRAVSVASNPEFLREGVALFDTFYPDRIVIGAKDNNAINTLREMYSPILEQTFIPPDYLPRPEGYSLPVLLTTTPTSAELIKYAANAFLAMKVSFINEIAGLSDRVGADIKEVARGIGLDKRIGLLYLNAGVGWGGSCFGKDVHALLNTAEQYDYEMPIVRAVLTVNQRQREEVIRKLQWTLKVIRGSSIGLLGLAFKPGTDDLRDAPSLSIARRLIDLGAHVKAYDPVAIPSAKALNPPLEIEFSETAEALFKDSDAVVLVTEWKEFSRLPYERLGSLMRRKIIIDGRNFLDPSYMKSLGFEYLGIGRGG